MNTSLTTFDGYPRPDIDVAQIRTTRARIIHLKNDYKNLMARIEVALQEHWANPSPDPSVNSTSTASATASSTQPARVEVPFAKVNSVVPSSPAATAGLRPGDKIIRFGECNWMNHEKLAKVAQTVQQNEGRVVVVLLARPAEVGGGEERVSVELVPRHNWGGRGMLGCHLLPL